jgi:hypothetical protein
LLSLLTLQAFSQSPSQPISGYDEVSGYFSTGGGSLSEQAQASRAAQIGQPVKDTDTPTLPIGTHYYGAMTSQQPSRVQNQTVAVSPIVNVIVPAKIPSAGIAKVSGIWSLKLNDNTSRKVALTLFQNGDAVYGTGNINLDANTSMKAAASGTVTGDKVILDIVSSGKVSLYRISMTISGDSATGTYTAFSPGLPPSTGTAEGLWSVS